MKFLILALAIFLQAIGATYGMGKKPASKQADETFCAMDVQECPDGSFVSRDPKKNCAFKDCLNVTTSAPNSIKLDGPACVPSPSEDCSSSPDKNPK